MVKAMIDKTTAMTNVLRKLDKLPQGCAIDLRTYKRNRSVLIRRTGPDLFDVVEDGFFQDRFQVPLSAMKKLLKTLFKKEFPRSTKIRVYDLGDADEREFEGRKTL